MCKLALEKEKTKNKSTARGLFQLTSKAQNVYYETMVVADDHRLMTTWWRLTPFGYETCHCVMWSFIERVRQ